MIQATPIAKFALEAVQCAQCHFVCKELSSAQGVSCFAPRSTLDVQEIEMRATKERPTGRMPRDNGTGGVDMWD